MRESGFGRPQGPPQAPAPASGPALPLERFPNCALLAKPCSRHNERKASYLFSGNVVKRHLMLQNNTKHLQLVMSPALLEQRVLQALVPRSLSSCSQKLHKARH